MEMEIRIKREREREEGTFEYEESCLGEKHTYMYGFYAKV